MSSTKSRRNCIYCGTDVTDHRYWKNREGKCVCVPCHRERKAQKNMPSVLVEQKTEVEPPKELEPALRQCACCGAQVTRSECHKNRHGEYICRTCRHSGRRTSRRRVLTGGLRRLGRWALQGAVVIVGLYVAYRVLGRLVEMFAVPPPN